MKCEICGDELQGEFEVEEPGIDGVLHQGVSAPAQRQWLICKFCNLPVCHECCLNPNTGYCNRHLPYYYNFPETEFK